MNNLPLVLGALGPIFTLILLGLGLRRLGFPGEGFWPAVERFTYFLLFPALLVHRLALARLGEYAVGPVATIIVVQLLAMTALVYALRPWLKVDGPAFSSVYQGAVRFNTYVGLAVALAVFHAKGGTVAALVMAITVSYTHLDVYKRQSICWLVGWSRPVSQCGSSRCRIVQTRLI